MRRPEINRASGCHRSNLSVCRVAKRLPHPDYDHVLERIRGRRRVRKRAERGKYCERAGSADRQTFPSFHAIPPVSETLIVDLG